MKHLRTSLVLLLTVALLLSLSLYALADEEPTFQYTLSVTDADGNEITNLKSLNIGAWVYVKITLTRTDTAERYGVYGVEFKLKSTGLNYNGDGASFDPGAPVSSNSFYGEDLTGVTYYDMSQAGVTIDNPVTVCTFSYQVATPAKANLTLATAIIYVSGSGQNNPEGNAYLTLDLDGGSFTGIDISGEYPSGTTVILPAAERPGYRFDGWSDGVSIYLPGARYTVTGVTSLVAQWTAQAILTLDPAGGTIPEGQDVSGVYQPGAVVQLPKPYRNGYDFMGWSDGVRTYSVGSFNVTADVTLTAKWRRSETYDPVTPGTPGKPENPETPATAWEWLGPVLETEAHPNYVVGYPDGGIHPTANITRAEVSTILYRLLTEESRATYYTESNAFADVEAEDWFNVQVSTLSNAGILNGYPDGNFYPHANITRAELTAVITRFVKAEGGSAPFSDVEGHWAFENIAKAYGLGWIRGYEDGTFRPNQPITRAETFAILNRMLNRHPQSEADLFEGMRVFYDNLDSSAWYFLDVQEAANNHAYTRKDGGFYEAWTNVLPDKQW